MSSVPNTEKKSTKDLMIQIPLSRYVGILESTNGILVSALSAIEGLRAVKAVVDNALCPQEKESA